jgi:arylsulfatase
VSSESWSQASVITKEYKLGTMLDPTDYRRNFDFRDFGDMFFVRKEDSLEINNQIDNPDYRDEIDQLREYYEKFKSEVPDTGKQEVVLNSK